MELTLLPERIRVPVQPDRPLLTSALMAGIALAHSCRGGSCGACRARLVEGQVDFPDGPGLGLTQDERDGGDVLLCRARPVGDVVVEVRTLRPAAEVTIRRLPCRIERLARLSPQVLGVWLRLPAVDPLDWQPGQYVDLILPDGTRRAYSIANRSRTDVHLELHVAAVPGGKASTALFALPAAGLLCAVEGPFGGLETPPAHHPAALVLVAGGTGYAPLRAILAALLDAQATRPLRLYLGVRHGADLYPASELRAWEQAHPNLRCTLVSEDGVGDGVQRGRVTEAVLAEETFGDGVEVLAAGPGAMVAQLRAGCLAGGLDAASFYADSFG